MDTTSNTAPLSPTVSTADRLRESVIAAYSPDNVYLWHQQLIGTNGDPNQVNDLSVTADGILAAGTFLSSMTTPVGKLTFAGGQDHSYLVGMNSAGVIQTAMHISGQYEVQGPCIAGNWVSVYVGTTLEFNSTTLPAGAGFGMVEFSPAHNSITQGKAFASNFGDNILGCTHAADNWFFITGFAGGPIDFGSGPIAAPGGTDAYVAKFSGAGQSLWSTSMGGLGNDRGKRVELSTTPAVLYDPAEGNLGNLGTFLANVNASGKLLWAMDLSDLAVADLAIAPNGDVYAVGGTSNPIITKSGALSPDPDSSVGFLIKLVWP